MTCPQCGAQNVAPDAASCPWCGRALAQHPAGSERTTSVPVAPEPNRKPYVLAGVASGLVLLLVIALVFALRGRAPVTQAPAANPPSPGAPVTQAPAANPPSPGAPVTQAPSANPPRLAPPDPEKAAIEAYLQKISYIEKQRQQVVNDLSEALLVAQLLQSGLGNPVPESMNWVWGDDPTTMSDAKAKAGRTNANQAQQTINDYVNRLRTLDGQLRATLPVPKPAFDFARSYDNAFAAYAGAMIKIGQVMNQGLSDPSQAQNLAAQLNALKGPLDVQAQQGLAAADQQLTALCGKYGITKPFDVTDKPVGGVTGQ